MNADPLQEFELWFGEYRALNTKTANAMVLSTVDHTNYPDSRVVLLKKLDKGQFIFYTHYNGVKGQQMEFNPHVALNFHWPEQARQIRVRGQVEKISSEESREYFESRPRESQLAALISAQSRIITSRNELDHAYQKVLSDFEGKAVPKPETWGGYALTPVEIEFWQGRDNRLHDRIQYRRQDKHWQRYRLAP